MDARHIIKFQYISDIHLEHRKIPIDISKQCENLVLCGDIGYPDTSIYKLFLNKCAVMFTNVFVVFGNHEYYSKKGKQIEDMNTIKTYMNDLPGNVYFLDNDAVYLTIENIVHKTRPSQSQEQFVKIIGSTLWSDIETETAKYMNDYKNIYITTSRKLQLTDTKQFFKINREYILQELDKDNDVTSVIVTHHGPHPVCNGSYPESYMTSAFVTYIPELYTKQNLKLCISGHTHSSVDRILNFDNGHSIQFVSNQVGYPGERNSVVKYKPNKIVNLRV